MVKAILLVNLMALTLENSISLAQVSVPPAQTSQTPQAQQPPNQGSMPDFQQWLKEFKVLKRESPALVGIYPMNVLVIKKFRRTKPPKFLNIRAINNYGMVSGVDYSSLSLFFKLNKRPSGISKSKKTNTKKSNEEWVSELFSPSQSDTIIDGSGSSWVGYQQENGLAKEVFKSEPPNPINKQEFAKWVSKLTSYDGVVLDVRGKSLLTATIFPQPAAGTQAFLLKDTERKFATPGATKNSQGLGIIEIRMAQGSFSIFEIIVQSKDGSAIPRGAKFIIDKK